MPAMASKRRMQCSGCFAPDCSAAVLLGQMRLAPAAYDGPLGAYGLQPLQYGVIPPRRPNRCLGILQGAEKSRNHDVELVFTEDDESCNNLHHTFNQGL
ncbi:hypothetical protein NDU88_002771 [Pleurodeles waltl]|uniref:Uncharacterized protein n=1 Tax=Pleurodeles waltl TaxID=8319 RepID=A0AAV7WR70_PLEWA|nr:hypothetical protein NDU88_002771 [Pleurodeles waltl]